MRRQKILPFYRKIYLGLFSLIFLATAALAQTTVTVIGPITPGDCAMFNSQTIVKDGGIPCPGSGGTLNLPNGTTATTQSPFSDNTTKVATDAFVQGAISLQTTHFAAAGTATCVGNALTVSSTSPTNFSLTGNPTISFIAGCSISGASTLSVTGTGVINIEKKTPGGLVATITGDIISGQQYFATYDGTQYELQTPSQIVPSQLAPIGAGHLLANATGSTASPSDTAATTWFDQAFCNTVGFIVARTTGGWACAAGIGVNVTWLGATGNCSTDDTTPFQNAWNAATGASGAGKIIVPATTGCYLVTKINGTNSNNIIVEGVGDQSLIKLNGFDTNGNWWDLSGSNNIQFKNLKFIDNGSPVTIAFLWACTGTSCGTSGVLSGLSFDHVNVNAKVGRGVLFAYGYGCAANCAANISGGSLGISNSSWKNTYNQSAGGEETRNAVLSLSAFNAGSFRSVYVTLTTSTAIAARTHIYNTDFIDQATAAGTLSNNASMVTDGVNQFLMVGGSIQCNCVADFIGWSSDEGLTFLQTAFQNPVPSAGCATTYWMEFGGGVNAAISLTDPFFSCPGTSGAIIALDQGVSSIGGGIWYLTVYGNDVGLNTNGDPFIGKTAAGCGSFTATNNWILGSNINLITGANNIVTCGSIDAHTIFQNVGTVTLAGGAADNSHHF
jgi:hypothetical protein